MKNLSVILFTDFWAWNQHESLALKLTESTSSDSQSY